MARKKKAVLTTDEKILESKQRIEELNNQLKEERFHLKELEKEKAAEDNAKIIQAAHASGKSLDEILMILQNMSV